MSPAEMKSSNYCSSSWRSSSGRVVLGATLVIGCITALLAFVYTRNSSDLIAIGTAMRVKSSTDSINGTDSTQTPNTTTIPGPQQPTSLLLPEPMDLVRRGIPLTSVYNFTLPQSFSGECSCQNPNAKGSCCKRSIHRAHKMGWELIRSFLNSFVPRRTLSDRRHDNYLTQLPVDADYRVVLVIRDLFLALVSGYLYHKSGKECWLSPNGVPGFKGTQVSRPGVWQSYLSYELDPSASNQDLCHYLAEVSDEYGMRAYMDFAMRLHYKVAMLDWALAREFDVLRERTHTVCFEDLESSDSQLVEKNVVGLLNFLYNGSPPRTWHHKAVVGNYSGGHATSHDPVLHARLVQVIQQLDKEYYDGEIAWAHSVLPCREDQ